MTATVPRSATFDDLRVGQLVAWDQKAGSRIFGGEIVTLNNALAKTDSRFSYALNMESTGQTLWILRDAPAPPVTVRRADYDAANRAWDEFVDAVPACERTAEVVHLLNKFAALVDNADTGADQ